MSEAVRSFILNIHSRVFRGQFRPYNFLLSVKEEFIWLKWRFLNNVMATSAKKRKPGLLSRCLAVVNKSTAKALVKYVAAPLALWLAAQGMAQATDLAAPGKADVEATFGQDSTMMYYFMIAEVFPGLYALSA